MMSEQEMGIYLFCGIQLTEEEDFGKAEIEGEETDLFTIRYKDAAMVAAEVPMKIFHPNRQNLMMHQQTVSKVMEKNDTVIPISFGNVFKTEDDIKVLLENLYPQFEKLFPAIKGKIEVGLKVIGSKEWLEEKVNENPQVGKMSSSVKGKSEAAGYYERIKLGGIAQKVFEDLQNELKAEVFTPLQEASEAAKANEPTGETMLLNAAFLIDRDKEQQFDEKVNEAYEKWKDKVKFHYSGPWPAYNFVNIRLKVEES
ncbi:GvpL/GvpF family gas vesicle protein [Metabacillus indicus]|uniref:Gas vesicle protein GvpF n=1 Tax=Metabacillus indicus TaxID=246786 RepID=A0A084H168_METID|nr:GvpL/GvpF family gas vesicle protein [Metabacillus indicus]KEZ53330.1 gas vesicle protein GvpF [Metabacillus indicus]MDX8289274.1 GvpL/GvpF family gas vesicle protein [Metabacillus indicus]